MRFNLRKSVVQSAALTLGGACFAAIVATGCSSAGSAAGDAPGGNASSGGTNDDSNAGTVGLSLTLPTGVSVDTITWTITGPNGGSSVVKTSTVDVTNSLEINFTVGGIPTGAGYTITLTAQATDGSLTCAGSATFAINPRMTTSVAVVLTCMAAGPDSGSLDIMGQISACATANGITALPGETTVGASVSLSASASGASPSGIGYTWSAPSGTFSAPNAANTSFTCTAQGPVTVTLDVSAGAQPDGSACDPSVATASTTILCDTDAGTVLVEDAGAAADAGGAADTGAGDAGSTTDATAPDAGTGDDGGGAVDAGSPVSDAGSPVSDASTGPTGDGGTATANLDVYRIGDGSSALSASAAPVFIDEYSSSGTLVQTLALPTTLGTNPHRLVGSGNATAEGLITRSADGHFLLVPGYDAAPGTATLPGTAAATVNRVVARVDASGDIDLTTALTDWADGSNPRSVTSPDGVDLWVDGAAGGVRHTTLGGTTSTELSLTVVNLRQADIFGSQLYVTSSSGTSVRLGAVGTGLPTTSGQNIVNIPGFPVGASGTPSPYGFFFADLDPNTAGLDTLYVADDSIGLTKYALVSGTWTAVGTVGTATDAYRGLTGVVTGTTVSLFATRGAAQLVALVDPSGYDGAFAATPAVLGTASTNTAYRGVALAPQ